MPFWSSLRTKITGTPFPSDYAKKFGLIRYGDDVLLLIQTLKDQDVILRIAAAQRLGEIGDDRRDRRAVEQLTAAAREDIWRSVRIAASEALGAILERRLGTRPITMISELTEAERETRRQTAQSLSQEAVGQSLTALQDNDVMIRCAAIEILGEIRDVRYVEPVTAALRDKKSEVIIEATEALTKLGEEAIPYLLPALKDKKSIVRSSIAWILGTIGSTKAVEPLTIALEDDNDDVRRQAAQALERLKKRE